MNTNVFGSAPNTMLPPQYVVPQTQQQQPQQQQQQQHQLPPQQFMSQPLTTNNQLSSSVVNQTPYNPSQTSGMMSSMPPPSMAPPPSQQQQQQVHPPSILNSSHQQLTTSMSGLAINPMKQANAISPFPQQQQHQPGNSMPPFPPQQPQQHQQANSMPPLLPQQQQKQQANSIQPSPQQQQQHQPGNSMPPFPPQQQQQQQHQQANSMPPLSPQEQQQQMYTAPPVSAPPPAAYNNQNVPLMANTNNNNFVNPNAPMSNTYTNGPPTVGMPPLVGNANQMSINSGNLQGLPHMPPKSVAGLPTSSQMPIQSFPGQPQTAYDTARPPMSGYPGTQQQYGPSYVGQQPLQPGVQHPGAQQSNMGPGPQMPSGARPGFNQHGAPPGNMYQQPNMGAAAPQRRLDPDQMPNPIQVMIENQRNAGGPFVTNQVGLLPPLVTTDYVVQDQGNCSPRYVRSTLYTLPATADLQKTTALPFSLIVSPFAKTVEGEFEPPIVDFGALGPIRCNRCKAYMSPNMQFIDAGRRFQCLMCKVSTEVPTEYFQHLDHTGQRMDKYERPELVLGTYEFLATKDYCRNNVSPEVPAFIFVIDVSYNTIKSGLVHLLCSQIKEIIKHLPVDQNEEESKVRVGFITYNSSVHFYNIDPSLAQPQMMVVGDVHDMFMPLLNGFLCHPKDSEAVIDALMEQIPKMFVDTKETETILYPAIQAGLEALKASNCTGKLLVFNSTLPIADAPGKLKNREDRKLLGTEKEKTILTPQCANYNSLGHECVQSGVSVDLFVFNNSYIDIATIGQVSRLTGGEIFKYTYFQADTDGKRLIEDIKKNISRPIGFDAVMRVRTSTGIRETDFYGHFFMTNTTDVELASVDSTKAIAVEIKHTDKLSPEENVYLQIALLYTSCGGQRRLRVFNLALRVSTVIADVFKTCDLDAMMLFFAKQACFKLMELTPKAVKDNVMHRSAQILACYRKHCTSPTSAGQLILPECLKLLPLYASCLLKNDAISGGSDMTLDERSYVIHFLLAMDLNLSVNFLYPRFIPLQNLIDDTTDEMPLAIRCTHEKMSEDGAYILENGVFLFVWLGQSLPQNFIQPLFGVQCTQQVNPERFMLNTETPLGQRIQNIIETIMIQRTRYMRITCVRQNDKLENVFRHFLVEDRGSDGSSSYVDFLCHMHKEIKDLLS